METVWIEIALSTLFGILGGLGASFGLRWGISLRCYRLEVAIADLQRVVLSVKGQAGADARWKKRDSLDDQLLSMAKAPKAEPRYANDPLVDQG